MTVGLGQQPAVSPEAMSTTAHTLEEIQPRDEPDRVFQRYVFKNPETCSNCFRAIKSDHVRVGHGTLGTDCDPKATRSVSVRKHKTAPGEVGPEGPLLGTREVDNTEIAAYPTRTVCEDCGSISGRADSDVMSRREALRRTESLADRLTEAGEPVDVDLLKRLVAHLKSIERFRGYDTECFEAATTIAVREARTRR
ncbi:hypothetical protein [Natrarchaeobaculum sulfurireducens]|uniref:Uncharacterized protein n=1 Tax=Natrarchaeobaculum sulfurireducens TaxID=2044521 RepID=A0A346PMQ7_9EURY|nr:hypothetical protein [Natrarchaeobaculum sulfurireducens]AXR80802.1 hypothetical protein AArcMg_0780 [Natrarchaeobaculum sulfurireducens]